MNLLLTALACATALTHAAVIEDAQYPDAAAARAAWVPMTGTAPVALATLEGQPALRFPCHFSDTKIERASWDRSVALDLSASRGVAFKLWCRDPSPISYFSLYFQSGDGWYHGSFFPEVTNGWNVITIEKAGLTTEGRPAGWGSIRTIRLSAWRAQDQDTEFYLTDLRESGVLGADAAVAILRAESVAQSSPTEKRSIDQFTEGMAQALQALELGCAVVSDLDVTAERLRNAKVVVLPHNPSLPDRVADELAQYTRQGGRLLVFYSVPTKLQPVLQVEGGRHLPAPRPGYFSSIRFTDSAIPGAPAVVNQKSWNISVATPVPGTSRVLAEWLDDQGQPTGQAAIVGSTNGLVMTHVLLPDDGIRKQRMVLALLGYLAPELWQQAVQAGCKHLGTVAGFKSYEDARTQIAALAPGQPRVSEALAGAEVSRDAGLKAAAASRYAEALDALDASGQQIEHAFCLAQRPQAGEFRAFWCHSAFGVEGLTWDDAIRRLAENGFTAILPNMLWGGAAYYESQLLPVAPAVSERGDQIAQCLAAARKYGVQVHVWKVNWNLGHVVSKDFVEQMRRTGRLQANAQGQEEPWLCPSHPDNQKLEIDSMVEVARRYDVDGLHFDYIRYPDSDHCFCAGCRERFQRAAQTTVARWPGDVLAQGTLRQPWLDWRRENITTVVKAVSEQARGLKPKLKISAAVFPRWPTDRDAIGQDWKLWCDRGYLDFVCPMDYTASNRSFENMVAAQVQWAGRVPCYPGIGVSASSSTFGVDRTIEQILLTRRYRTGGFTIFNYGAAESRDLLPLLGLGITAKK
jgi:uncharacterized lipoprotein YddW (UPF0748 family)